MTEPEKTETKHQVAAELDRDIEWFVHRMASALGERGTLAAVINIAKQGSVGISGVPNTDIYTDEQLGWGETPDGERRRFLGDVERARRLQKVWRRLSPETHNRLFARYATSSEWPPGVQAWFGPLAGLALYLAPDPTKVLKACANASEDTAKAIIEGALRRAQKGNQRAHEEWRIALRSQRMEDAQAWAQHDPEVQEGGQGA